jgi:hypothetical protein
MTTDLIAIRWTGPDAKGYTDLLPIEVFANEGTTKELTHFVVDPKGRLYKAKCRLGVQGTTAHLDYQQYSTFNERQGMDLGVLRLRFANTQRDVPMRIDWRAPGQRAFSKADATLIDHPFSATPPYRLQRASAKRVRREIRERSGQLRFRSTLLFAYSGKCCISNCAVTEALEGAHIDPFSGNLSDHPQNGLLLRRDLHALFDANLLAIDPITHLVHFATPVLAYPEYKALHATARLAKPKFGASSFQPSNEALNRRWRRFNARA